MKYRSIRTSLAHPTPSTLEDVQVACNDHGNVTQDLLYNCHVRFASDWPDSVARSGSESNNVVLAIPNPNPRAFSPIFKSIGKRRLLPLAVIARRNGLHSMHVDYLNQNI